MEVMVMEIIVILMTMDTEIATGIAVIMAQSMVHIIGDKPKELLTR